MKFLDLFAGIGGFRLGMEAAGHECVGFVEIDKFARQSYKAIHDTEGEIEYHDITTVSDEQWRELQGKVDVITGGFPCQAFSVAGKRQGFEDTRGTLFFEIARAAKQIQPRLLLLENVKGLLSHDKGNTFRVILDTLDELGYDAEWRVLNSKDFGVPQNRERVFIVGHLRGASEREVFSIGESDGATAGEIKRVIDGKKTHGHGSHDVYGTNGISATVRARDYKGAMKIKVAGMIEKGGTYTSDMNRRVYGADGISPALPTMQGGGQEPKVLLPQPKYIDGKRQVVCTVSDIAPTIRATQHKSGDNQAKVAIPVLTPDRGDKRQNGRRFKNDGEEMFTLTGQDRHGVMIKNNSPLTPALEAHHHDNISLQTNARGSVRKGYSGTVSTAPDAVLIKNPLKGKTTNGWHFEQNVYEADGISRAVKAGGGSGNTPKIIQNGHGFNNGGEHEIAPTVSSSAYQNNNFLKNDFRIRKLTPRECRRLQGFPDWAFDKAQEVCSDTQLYKQAGNSVTVPVIEAIAREL